jgi:peptidoglycan L-alanyl-D-glutamate endopeptidase CwlK
MSAIDKIRQIQRILGVKDDGDFRTISRKALENLITEASAPPKNDPATEFDARTEKNLATLHPKAQPAFRAFLRRLIPHMAAKGVVAKVISGNRTYAEQNELYAQGRTKPGKRVTNAWGGMSNHNFGVALDIGLFKGAEYLTSSPLYAEAGPIGESVGLKWGGRWTSLKDEPHFEYPTGLTMLEMRERVAKGEDIL